jgi:hypothetical protein
MTINKSGIASDFFSANGGGFSVVPEASFESKVEIKGSLKVTGETSAKKVTITDLEVSDSVNFTCGAESQTGIYARFA